MIAESVGSLSPRLITASRIHRDSSVTQPVNAHHLPGRPGLRLLRHGQSTGLHFGLQD